MTELGDRELEVMSVLWSHGPATVAEVRARLSDALAYTTVLTILRNLEAKGAVRHTAEGRAHRYAAHIEREAARRTALARVIDGLFGGRPERVMAHLVESHGVDPSQLEALRALLDQRLTSAAPPAPKPDDEETP